MSELLSKWAILKQEEAEEINRKAEIVLERLKIDKATPKEIFLNWGMLKVKLNYESKELSEKAFIMYQDFIDLNC